MLQKLERGGHPTWPFALVLFALGAAATAQETAGGAVDAVPEEREWIGGAPFVQWTRLFGDVGGWRSRLDAAGIEVAGSVTWDWTAPWRGGLRNRDSVGALLDVNITFDLEQLLGLSRTVVWVDCYSVQGRDPSDDVGDVQGVTNLQAPDTDEIAEVWLETWLGDTLRVKFGKVDWNSEFAFTEEGGEFVHPSAAITPTIVGCPTYPNPATAFVVSWQPDEFWHVGAGVFDGDGANGIRTGRHGLSGFFDNEHGRECISVFEVGHGWTGGGTWGSGRLAVGAWYHSARFDRFDGGSERGVVGGYAVLDQRIWRERPDSADDRQGIGGMVYVGLGDGDVADIARHFEVGVTWTGALQQRDFDVIGLLVTMAVLSDEPGAGFDGDETAIEAFYKVQLTPAFSLKPDLMLIVNPGGDPSLDDALVATLRAEIVL